MLRRRRQSDDPLAHVDPAAAPRRFAGVVADAVDSRRRYHELVAGLRPGPVRDRLAATGERVDAGVAAAWSTAQRAGDLERLLASLDPDRVTDEYKRAKRSADDPELEAALAQRFGSVQRLLNALDDTEERLRLLDARLSAAVARVAEVALVGGTGTDEVGAELETVVEELTALRTALDDLS
jgi:hypothetical protein